MQKTPLSSFFQGTEKGRKGRKFPPSRTFPLRLRKRQRGSGSLWMGTARRAGWLHAITLFLQSSKCVAKPSGVFPFLGLIPIPLFGKAQGRWEDHARRRRG